MFDTSELADPVLADGDRFDLPAAGVALLKLEPGTYHLATGHELGIDMQGRTLYWQPGDELTAEVTTYVVTPLAA